MKQPENLTKLYYSIGEVAEMFGVKTSLIRHYESEITFFKPEKRHGERRFTKKDIETFALLYKLVKEKGYTLEGAEKEFKNFRRKEQRKAEALDKLRKVRGQMRQMREKLS